MASLLGSHQSYLRVLLPFPITFAMCASQEQSFETFTPRYGYWSALGNSSSPHFHLKVTGFTLPSLHTSTAHCFYVRCLLCFRNPSGVSDTPTKSIRKKINPDTASSPTVTPCLAASTATIMSSSYHHHMPYINWVTTHIPVRLLVQGVPINDA